jgi:hypothetical protein
MKLITNNDILKYPRSIDRIYLSDYIRTETLINPILMARMQIHNTVTSARVLLNN